MRPQSGEPETSPFDQRWRRVMDCVELRRPDRMPIGLFAHFWHAKYGGISFRDLMYDGPRAADIVERVCLDLQPDMYTPVFKNVAFGKPLEASGFRQLQWPGHGVSDDRPFQYLDREYMTADEYKEFLFDPTGFYLSKYLPRVCAVYEGLEPIASLTGSFYVGVAFAATAFADPRIQQAVSNLSTASATMISHGEADLRLDTRMQSLGFPSCFGSVAMAPYDIIADYFRGAKGMMTDLRRHPDTLLEVLDKMAVFVIRGAREMARQSNNPIVGLRDFVWVNPAA